MNEKDELLRMLKNYIEYVIAVRRMADVDFYERLYEYINNEHQQTRITSKEE